MCALTNSLIEHPTKSSIKLLIIIYYVAQFILLLQMDTYNHRGQKTPVGIGNNGQDQIKRKKNATPMIERSEPDRTRYSDQTAESLHRCRLIC